MSKVLDELHKIREEHYEKIKHLSPKERVKHIRQEAEEAAKELGLKLKASEPTPSK